MLVKDAIERLQTLPPNEEIAMIHFQSWEISDDLTEKGWGDLVGDASDEAEDAAKNILEETFASVSYEVLSDLLYCAICDSEDCKCDQKTDSIKEG